MIEGVVNAAHEAELTLDVKGIVGPRQEVLTVIDIGFTGALSLRPELVEELGLPFKFWDDVTLADGSVALVPVHEVTVHWDGKPVDVDAHIVDSTPLLGMRLLCGHVLHVDVEPGGRVVVVARRAWWGRWLRGVGWGRRRKMESGER